MTQQSAARNSKRSEGSLDAEVCARLAPRMSKQGERASIRGLYFLPNVVYPGISLVPVGQKIVMNINVAPI